MGCNDSVVGFFDECNFSFGGANDAVGTWDDFDSDEPPRASRLFRIEKRDDVIFLHVALMSDPLASHV